MKFDHVVIGAGIAGIALRHSLRGDVVLLDPSPGSYKIGESIIPEQFMHPLMAEALPTVSRCESYSTKLGTTFIGDGEVACFPLDAHAAGAMHVYRPDMEATLLEHFGIQVRRERVIGVDVGARTVHTDEGVYESRGPIIDCSGPAMVVANALGDVRELWPVHATWAYYDIDDVDDARHWRMIGERGWKTTFLDIPTGRLLPKHSSETFPPSQTTVLTQIRPGTWMWQIPLWNRSRLSVGVVSREGPVSREEFRRVVSEHHLACYALSPRPEDGASPLDRVHHRSGFAKTASRAATEDYILLGDAYAFADPIYSVGTGLAVNKAISIGLRLAEGPWTAADARRYSEDFEALIQRAVRAFDFWYTGAVMRDDAAAAEVQRGFLSGGAFREGAVEGYTTVLTDAGRSADVWVRYRVEELLSAALAAGPWHVATAEPTRALDGVVVSFGHPDRGSFTLEFGRPDADRDAMRRVADVRVMVRGPSSDIESDTGAMRLVDEVCAAIARNHEGWLGLFAALS